MAGFEEIVPPDEQRERYPPRLQVDRLEVRHDGPSGAELEKLTKELARLRPGLGLHAPDVLSRVGPRLRALCDIQADSPPGWARQQLVRRIIERVSALPPDLRLAVQSAFGLPPALQSRFLRERMEWLGNEIGRDPRTAIRRVESGLALLAERMAGPETPAPAVADTAAPDLPGDDNQFAPEGWYVDKLTAVLSFQTDPVSLQETRRITATRDALDRLQVSWSVPPVDPAVEPSGLTVQMMYGGELNRDEPTSSPTYWSGWIRLPRPLRRGEQHEYQVRVTSLDRAQLRPYYVLSPYRRCDEFELRAKFPAGSTPARIWRLDGVPYRLIDEHREIGDPVETDAVGEVAARFHRLHQGLSYGLQWRD